MIAKLQCCKARKTVKNSAFFLVISGHIAYTVYKEEIAMEKQQKKCLLGAAVGLAAPVLLQKGLFAAAAVKNPYETDLFYDWRLGKIHYKKAGSGRPVLLVHGIGIGCSHLEWEKNIETLSKHYQVYALDLLGFGWSSKPKTTYTAYTYATLLNDFVQEVIGRPTAIFASNTSAIFAVLAYTLARGNYRRMVLIEPSGIVDEPAGNCDRIYRKLLESPVLGDCVYLAMSSRMSIRSFLAEKVFFSEADAASRPVSNLYYYPAHLGGCGVRYAFASFLTRFMILDIKPHLAQVKIPLYILWGEEAVINPIENMERVREIKPNAAYYVFEDTRLLPHFENHKEFNKLVREILR